MGGSIAYLGDIKGDGLADILVGNPSNQSAPSFLPGQVIVFNGPGSTGFTYTDPNNSTLLGFSVTGLFGSAISGANAKDFAAGSPNSGISGEVVLLDTTITGGPPTYSTNTSLEDIGTSLDSIADLNGDGVRDLIVGAPGVAMGNGAVRLIISQNRSLFAEVQGPSAGSLGSSVADVGELEGDMDPEFLAGAPDFNSATGRAYLYSSIGGVGGTTLLCVIDGPSIGSGFGSSVRALGDFTGDGRSEFIVSAPGANSGSGVVYVYTFSSTSKECSLVTSISGTLANENFGKSLAGLVSPNEICDLNGDNRPDMIVGSTLSDQSGRVTLLTMNPPPTPSPTPTPTVTPVSGPTEARITYQLTREGEITGRVTLDQDPGANCAHSIYGRYSRADLSELGPVKTIFEDNPLTTRVSRYRASDLRKAQCAPDRQPYSYHLITEVTCGSQTFLSNVFARQTNCGLEPPLGIQAWEKQLELLPQSSSSTGRKTNARRIRRKVR